MKNHTSENARTRRQLLDGAPREMLGYFASIWRGEVRWYEVVQDKDDEELWYINLFEALDRGDIRKGRLVQHYRMRADSVDELRDTLRHPLKVQYHDGRSEQDFEMKE